MHAIVIDPHERTVEAVDFDGTLGHLYVLIQTDSYNSRYFENCTVRFGLPDPRGNEPLAWFRLPGTDEVFFCRMLITGPGKSQETACLFSRDDVAAAIRFGNERSPECTLLAV